MNSRACHGIFFAALTAVVGLHLRFVLEPIRRDTRMLTNRLAAAEKDIRSGMLFSSGLEDVVQLLDDFEKAMLELDRLVPRQFDADQRIRQVSAVIKDCGLRDDSIRPDPPQSKGAIIAHPLTLKVAGEYSQLLRFLFLAEALPQFTRVTRLVVTRDDSGGRLVNAEIELTSFSTDGGGET